LLCPDKFLAFINKTAVKCVIEPTNTKIIIDSIKPNSLTEKGKLKIPAPITVLIIVTVVNKKSVY